MFSKNIVISLLLQLTLVGSVMAENPFDWLRSQIDRKKGMTTFEKLPCASQGEYKHYVEILKMDDSDLPGKLCGDGSKKEKIGKIFKFLDSLKVDVPSDWKGGADEALKDPMNYLASMGKSFNFDWNTTGGVVAYNFFGSIFIGNYFFTQLPLDAIDTLVHESRHSDVSDPGHVRCLSGDRVQESGACDEWFDVGINAGAYAYGASYSFGIARYAQPFQISDEDREHIKMTAVSLMGRRFNALPDNLGLPFDLLYANDTKGTLFYHHPILRQLFLVDPNINEGASHIQFDRRSNGVIIYGDKGGVYNDKEQYGPFSNLFSDISSYPEDVKQYVVMTGGDSSDSHILTTDNEIWIKKLNFDTLKFVFEKTPYTSSHPILKLAHARTNIRFALLESGKLFHFSDDMKDFVPAPTLIADTFQDPKKRGWIDINGGLFQTELMGINRAGEMYREVINSDGDPVMKSMPLKMGNFTTVKAYQEGVNIRVVKPSDNSPLFIQRYDNTKNSWSQIRVIGVSDYHTPTDMPKDFALTRKFKPGTRFMGEHPVNKDFIRECDLIKWDIDPWSGKGMGVSRNHELVFESSFTSNRCDVFDDHGVLEVSDFRFVGTKIDEPGVFSSASLELLTDTGWRRITPYENTYNGR